MAAYSRVWFYGEGPDNALRHEWDDHLSYLDSAKTLCAAGKSACELVVRSRRIPFLSRIGRALSARLRPEASFPNAPNGSIGFVSRLKLRERWEEIEVVASPSPHPWRPRLIGRSKVCSGIVCSVNRMPR